IIDGAAAATPDGDDWFMALGFPLYGFENDGPDHVAGTDVIQVLRTGEDIRSTTDELASGATDLEFTPATPLFASGDVVMVCDMKVLGVFRANGDSSAAGSVSFAAGAGANACDYFPMPNTGACAGAAIAYPFPKFATISSMQGVRWVLRDPDGDAASGYSLGRQVNGGGAVEVVRGVCRLQCRGLTGAGDVGPRSVPSGDAWCNGRAGRMTLTLREPERTGADGH